MTGVTRHPMHPICVCECDTCALENDVPDSQLDWPELDIAVNPHNGQIIELHCDVEPPEIVCFHWPSGGTYPTVRTVTPCDDMDHAIGVWWRMANYNPRKDRA